MEFDVFSADCTLGLGSMGPLVTTGDEQGAGKYSGGRGNNQVTRSLWVNSTGFGLISWLESREVRRVEFFVFDYSAQQPASKAARLRASGPQDLRQKQKQKALSEALYPCTQKPYIP